MHFPLGRPILVLSLLAIFTGGMVALRRPAPNKDLALWTFADSHADSFQHLLPDFQHRAGRQVAISLIPLPALNMRLSSLFMAGTSDGLPDAVELELNTIGQYLRGPVSEVGLLPLNRYLERSGFREIDSPADLGHEGWNARCRADGKIYTFTAGRWTLNPARDRPDAWIDRMVRERFALWSRDRRIFGVPHDIHPITITYRDDLYRAAGIDLSTAQTWPQFQEMGLRFQAYWGSRRDGEHPDGYLNRHALELYEAQPDHLVCLLLQRHVNLIDAAGDLHLNDPKVIETIAFYARLIAGPDKVAVESSAGTGPWVNDVLAGNICAVITPDWRANYLKTIGPALAGKLRMMPLPKFDPDDAPTSTWSGTMIGIPKNAKDPDRAWQLIESLYLSDAAMDARVRDAGILPPVRDYWSTPRLHEKDPFFSGQKIFELYIDLADRVPAKTTTWATPVASEAVGFVMTEAARYVRAGKSAAGLDDFIRGRLRLADWFVRRYLRQGTY